MFYMICALTCFQAYCLVDPKHKAITPSSGSHVLSCQTLTILLFPKTEIASSTGRVAQTTNVVMGGTVTDDATDEWLVLDKKVFSLLH